jgi:hypothetical protein
MSSIGDGCLLGTLRPVSNETTVRQSRFPGQGLSRGEGREGKENEQRTFLDYDLQKHPEGLHCRRIVRKLLHER